MAEGGVSFCVVNNIPKTYHAADLRNFFSQFLETGGFDCFHFRHRPELQVTEGQQSSKGSCSDDPNRTVVTKTTCCVVRVPTLKVDQFIKMYGKKHWLTDEGETLTTRCFISKIKISDPASCGSVGGDSYKTRAENRQIPESRITFTKTDLDKLAEMHPPPIMPKGNVGTPTSVFLELIHSCRLPPKVIGKLKLEFPKSRGKRKYGSVPFDYGTKHVADCWDTDDEPVLSADGREILSVHIPRPVPVKPISEVSEEKDEKREESDEDDDTGEEWDRHESLHNDVTQQDRVKERLYEEEIELQWEKGGSGLCFYTDAQYWDALEGDFDEKTTDDWDIDTSIYYEKGAGDKDARDFVQMRREERLRNGEEEEVTFCKKHKSNSNRIGAFEKHTKGFGRKIMERRGWKDGEGLGNLSKGMVSALENDGQLPSNKTGFGYHGQKLNRYLPGSVHKRRRGNGEVLIATVYDKRCDIEPREPLLRSNLPTATKYRTPYFIKSNEVLNAIK